ncbi:PEP/pyruvate-binding domain-containing protein [Agromyces sp. NPDC058104]|uniref:PEP/pyruvate-binding domain-containing protein n=1 Tax=Agromyces sp. NPDC058104 TaxID=3346342 RepID=UPI0036DA9E54
MHTTVSALIPLDEAAGLPVGLIGGKALRLAKLRADGRLVPDGFVLSSAVHDRATRSAGAPAVLPDELRAPFIAACDRLGYPIVVRSSAVAEDLAGSSFAGQFESVLHVASSDEAIAAVERCWRATTSEHLAAYRDARRTGDGSLALLVQRQLAPASAGVAFGRDPVSGDDRVVIEAVAGLADRLLGGATSPERWTVERDAAVRRTGADGPALLDEAEVLRVAELVRQLGEVFGAPQDVEWAFAGGELNVVQSRPITTLPAPEAAGAREPVPATWLRDSLHWPDRLSPFGVGIWAGTMRAGLGRAADLFGLLISTAEVHVVDHRVYAEVIPFGGPSKLPPPPGWLLPLLIRVVPALRSRIARSVEAVRADTAGDVLERWVAQDAPRLTSELQRRRRVDLAVLDLRELFELLDETREFFDETLAEHFAVVFALSQVMGEYVFLARDLLGWEPARALFELRARSWASTDAAVALDELAERAIGTSAAAADRPVGDLATLAAADAGFAEAVERYLERYGGRMLGLDPMDPTLAEAPDSLQPAFAAAVGRVRARLGADPVRTVSQPPTGDDSPLEDLALEEASEHDRLRWRRAVARAARYYGARDESELLGFNEPLGSIRRITVEIGARLAAQGALRHADDCFMLTPDEFREACGGGERLRRVASERRRSFDEAALLGDRPEVGALAPPPNLSALPAEARFANEALVWYLGSITGQSPGAVPADALAGGTPASAGRARGPVRIVRGPDDFPLIRQGDVLVCPTTAPSWSPILGQVAAVVADHGGVLSHPAIIAREFGIPAIVGTGDGTSRLHDGEVVLVDGTTGTVRR